MECLRRCVCGCIDVCKQSKINVALNMYNIIGKFVTVVHDVE